MIMGQMELWNLNFHMKPALSLLISEDVVIEDVLHAKILIVLGYRLL